MFVVAVKQIACGDSHTAFLFEDGRVGVLGSNFFGQSSNIAIPCDKKAVQVACGDSHTAVLYEDGTVKLLGSNSHGQTNQQDLNVGSII